MPGMIHHIAFAKKISKELNLKKDDEDLFIIGNLLPDYAKDKNYSHFRKNASVSCLQVPNLDEAKNMLFKKDNLLYLGMYSHLFLDYHFIEGYLIKMFEFDFDNNIITNKMNNKKYTKETFFSSKKDGLLYHGYSHINYLMIKNKIVDLSDIFNLPDILPETNIDFFDDRKEYDWKKELKYYLNVLKENNGIHFDFNKIMDNFNNAFFDFILECENSK